ncbi:MAG: phosphatidate cytidylyltransferase [Candidatus Marinamargulisbacteria bacterium]|jgi:phosphatidate cytidylyltransferase
MVLRILTGLTLLGIGTWTIFTGGIYYFSWIFMVTLVSLYEIFKMFKPKRQLFVEGIIYLLVAGLLLSTYLSQTFDFWRSAPVKGIVFATIVFSLLELRKKKLLLPSKSAMINIRILLFVASTFPFLYLMRTGPNGFHNMLFCFSIIVASDSFAYFSGKFWGKRKLSELSPNKTVEGSIGAIIGSLLIAYIYCSIFSLDFTFYSILTVVISIFTQLGDLHESLTKRFFNVKDSSQLLPGHGGFYDRVDGYLFVMPLAFYFFNW